MMSGIYCSLLTLDLTNTMAASIMRITDAPFDIEHNDYTYRSYGSLLNIDPVTVENTLSSKELMVTMSGVNTDYISVVNENTFVRRPITIEKAFIPEGDNVVQSSTVYWRGYTSTPEARIDYENGSVEMLIGCKSMFNMDQTPSLSRSNNATHQAHHNGDRFFSYANQPLDENDVLWRKP
ncbi:hypothetical protein K6U17_14355 [Vibrio fluvialis]|uniref:hypothetical protein n=1 Tax=Vibrio fluvialis TaxID=676 RepID=UPI001EEACCA0|nr:hypothetical protein [Vibrio fluvialis]MCG6410400.1 hypothetical protein [Vibrio fluvialis]